MLESPLAFDRKLEKAFREAEVPLSADVSLSNDGEWKAATKWGSALDGGFQIIPDLIFRYQSELGLSTNDLVILLHLTMAWWEADKPPFPRPSTIAKRMNTSERTVQRSLSRLEKCHLFKKTKARDNKGEWRQAFDLTPLANRLKEIAMDDMLSQNRRKLRTETSGFHTQTLAPAQ